MILATGLDFSESRQKMRSNGVQYVYILNFLGFWVLRGGARAIWSQQVRKAK